MNRKSIPALAAACLLLGATATAGRAGEPLWRGVTLAPPTSLGKPVPTAGAAAASIGRPQPLATIGRPVPVGPAGDAATAPYMPGAAVIPVNYTDAQPHVVRSEAPGDFQPLSGPPPAPPPPPPPPPPSGPYGGEPYNHGVELDHPLNRSFGDRCREFFGMGNSGGSSGSVRQPFQSDHAFDGLISPVSNPFFFEDPRSLTEIKPLFIYQSVPRNDPYFQGGSAEFYGVQGRLAFNEKWSVVINKLGFVSLQPKFTDGTLTRSSGFAEFDIGPKWTFYRNETSGGIAAAGVNFDIPIGDRKVFQHTGTLALDPYINYGKSFGRLPDGYGSFNFLGQAGYNFGVDNKRAEFFHTSYHIDYDVANLHKFYPLVELNWFHYTKRGTAVDVGTEGADFINFGSSRLTYGRDVVRAAVGGRYKFNENMNVGVAFEFPLTTQKSLSDFRLGIDFIFRY